MARPKHGSGKLVKADVIREYLAKYPHDTQADLARRINASNLGITVKSQEVSNVVRRVREKEALAATTAAAVGAAPAQVSLAGAAPAVVPMPARAGKPGATAPVVEDGAVHLADVVVHLKAAKERVGADEAKRLLDVL